MWAIPINLKHSIIKGVHCSTGNSEIFARILFSRRQSFVKIKHSRNGENSLSFTDVGKSSQSCDFLLGKYVF